MINYFTLRIGPLELSCASFRSSFQPQTRVQFISKIERETELQRHQFME
jgi:hypothetical protein